MNEQFKKICARYSINWGDSGNHKAALYEIFNKKIEEIKNYLLGSAKKSDAWWLEGWINEEISEFQRGKEKK